MMMILPIYQLSWRNNKRDCNRKERKKFIREQTSKILRQILITKKMEKKRKINLRTENFFTFRTFFVKFKLLLFRSYFHKHKKMWNENDNRRESKSSSVQNVDVIVVRILVVWFCNIEKITLYCIIIIIINFIITVKDSVIELLHQVTFVHLYTLIIMDAE